MNDEQYTAKPDISQYMLGVSNWQEFGKRYGYWNYFREQVIKEIFSTLPKTTDSSSNEIYWRGFNDCLEEVKVNLNSIK